MKANRKKVNRTMYEDMYWEWEEFGNTLEKVDAKTAEAFILIRSIRNLYEDHMRGKQGRK